MMPKYLTTEELKDTQLDILKYIDRICKENDIRYFVSYGTLLGAVRHKGFIPWDDDIDISMYRSEYDKFIQAVEKDQHPYYKILSKETSDWYFQNFLVVTDERTVVEDHIKVDRHDTSVFVDVFPIERYDDIKLIDKAHLMATLRMIAYIKLQYVQYGDSQLKDICRKIMWYALRIVNPRWFGNRIDALIKKYRKEDGQYEGLVGCGKDGRKEVFPRGTFEELIELPFEDMMVPAPKEYDVFLSQFYGDYMTVPSQEEIDYKSHLLQAYRKDEQ